jgi:hypothetical protein
MASLPQHQQEVLRAAVCTSTVLVFSPRSEPPTLDEPVLMAFVEFSVGNVNVLVDGYLTSLRAMQTHAAAYQQHVLHPPAAVAAAVASAYALAGPEAVPVLPYTPATHRLFVLLDLDKTGLLSDGDCREDQRHLFIPDINIEGITAVTNGTFRYGIMLRRGMHTFLRRVMAVADVGVVTAGDVHYARAAVGAANDRAWATGSPDSSLPVIPLPAAEAAIEAAVEAPAPVPAANPAQLTPIPPGLPDVRIPLTHVFSVRHQPKHALPKTFARALPFVPLLHASGAPVPVLAVDDDVSAWDPACRHQVLPILPFQPGNNSPECLLHLATVIETAAQNYYTVSAAAPAAAAAAVPLALPHIQSPVANAATNAANAPVPTEEMDFGARSDDMDI